jgi:diguanylate cyclase (GGDEF)-like protein
VSEGSRTIFLSALLLALVCTGSLAEATPAKRLVRAEEASAPWPTLTTARQVHSLVSSDAARAYPVHLRGIVTYFDPSTGDGSGALFVCDATGCIFVRVAGKLSASLPVGTLIDLRGVSNRGEFAPIVAQPQIREIRYSGLPASPHRPSLARLKSGQEDGQWVEVEGVIHSIVEQETHVDLQLAMVDGSTTVHIVRQPGTDYSGLVDAAVRIRGNPGPLFDVNRRQMIGVNLHCPGFAAIRVLVPAPAHPFSLPTLPINTLLQWDVAPLLAHRVHVAGRGTLQWPGSSVCLTDATGGICAQTGQRSPLMNGELIDIVGFVSVESGAPVLTDALFRSAGASSAQPVPPAAMNAEQLLRGDHESQLVQTEGQLISRDLASSDTVLLLSSGKYIFKSILPRNLAGPETQRLENGSILHITGICSVQLDEQRSTLGLGTAVPTTFRILMRAPGDVTVVRKASWWTPVHAVLLLAFALCITLAVLAWVVKLRKRIRESEERFRHLANHDSLTGLASRLVLADTLAAALATAQRHHSAVALLMLDLDEFKEINDTLGHQAGDEVLRVSARRIQLAVRSSDTVVRVGGDEFVVLLPGLRDLRMAERIAASIVETLSTPIQIGGLRVAVSASVGISTVSGGDLDADVLLRQADVALYRAKERGKGSYQIFTTESDPIEPQNAESAAEYAHAQYDYSAGTAPGR